MFSFFATKLHLKDVNNRACELLNLGFPPESASSCHSVSRKNRWAAKFVCE